MNANSVNIGRILGQNHFVSRLKNINYSGVAIFLVASICAALAGVAIVFRSTLLMAPAAVFLLIAFSFLKFKTPTVLLSRSYAWILIVIVFGTAISPLLARVSPFAVQNLADLILFVASIGFVFAALPYLARSKILLFAFILLLLMWTLQLASSIYGRSNWFPAVYQFGYNLKWPLMFISGFAIAWESKLENKVWVFLTGFAFVLLFFSVLQIVSPSFLNSLFAYSINTYGGESNPFIPFIKRLGGFYTLSTNTAAIASVGLIFMLTGWLRHKNSFFIYGLLAYGIVLIFTGQRNELVALIISIAIYFLLFVQRPIWQKVFLSGLSLILLGIGIFLLAEQLQLNDLLWLWGITGELYKLTDRVALTVHGYEVAQQYYPLGAGLGTYGGVAAMKFDPSLYDDLGFYRYYYWYRQGMFLMDTYWPNIYAEGGLYAAYVLAAIFCLILLFAYQLKTPTVHARAHRAAAFSILIFMLLNTISSTVLTDPKYAWMAWLSFGWAYYFSTQSVESDV
nr:hypothetical protein [uncultured Deefgea sp.]